MEEVKNNFNWDIPYHINLSMNEKSLSGLNICVENPMLFGKFLEEHPEFKNQIKKNYHLLVPPKIYRNED